MLGVEVVVEEVGGVGTFAKEGRVGRTKYGGLNGSGRGEEVAGCWRLAVGPAGVRRVRSEVRGSTEAQSGGGRDARRCCGTGGSEREGTSAVAGCE